MGTVVVTGGEAAGSCAGTVQCRKLVACGLKCELGGGDVYVDVGGSEHTPRISLEQETFSG